MKPCIELQSDILYYTGVRVSNPHHIAIPEGITVVIGANGSGKTTLANILEKGWNFRTNKLATPSGNKPSVRKIEFSDIHTLSGMKVEYYQQRYEATMNDEVPTVEEIMADRIDSEKWARYTTLFRLIGVEGRKINYLSSGELRKLLIINALMTPTDLLILDNPYIGLDAASRDILNEAIEALSKSGMNVMLLISNPDDIPAHANCVIPMRDMTIMPPITDFESVKNVKGRVMDLFDFAVDLGAIPLPPRADNESIDVILRLRDCEVRYGRRTILSHVDWEIGDGQYWALAGPNGSGKSTLLSLVCADNPQAYCNDITLFDRRRGSGESIWDIKSRISFISPEVSLHFHPAGDVATIVAQGLNDTTGIFIPLKPGQKALADRWLKILHMEHLANRNFGTLSSGERQMVMLARTFIKQPRLMILDEPLHALDYARARAARAIINHFAARSTANMQRYPMSIIFVSHYLSEYPECIKYTKTLP